MHENAAKGPLQRTPEWYAMRNKVFGASETAALLGLSPYKTPLDLYLDKLDDTPPDPDNANMMVGRHMEPAILNIYSETEDVGVTTNLPAYYLPAESYPLLASLDGQREDDERPVEAKFTASPATISRLGEEGSDWIPLEWLLQVGTQMLVADSQAADVAVFVQGKLRIYKVDRNDDLIHSIKRGAEEMRQRLANHDPPPIDFEHGKALDAVKRQYPHVIDERVILEPDQSRVAHELFDVSDKIKDLEKRRKALQAELLSIMGAANVAQVPGDHREIRRTEIAETEVKAFTKKAHVRLTIAKARRTAVKS